MAKPLASSFKISQMATMPQLLFPSRGIYWLGLARLFPKTGKSKPIIIHTKAFVKLNILARNIAIKNIKIFDNF